MILWMPTYSFGISDIGKRRCRSKASRRLNELRLNVGIGDLPDRFPNFADKNILARTSSEQFIIHAIIIQALQMEIVDVVHVNEILFGTVDTFINGWPFTF
jgi:hypothetical protein